jgi:sortase A
VTSGRAAVRGFGEVLITLGVVILLLCVYQLFYTNIESNRAQNKIRDDLAEQWKKPVSLKQIPLGDGFALMRIPRLGPDWVKPIVEGVGTSDLSQGLGHYPKSVMPGQVGNFAVAGHRATHGEPFREMDTVGKGDVVVVEMKESWFIYRVDRDPEIVLPTEVDVVLPVPRQPDAKPTKKLITLTTCHPRWASTHRMIVFGHLEKVEKKVKGKIPAVLTAAPEGA